MTGLTPPNNSVARRVDLPCSVTGFDAPPCHVHLKFLPVGDRWSLLARAAVDKQAAVAQWLQAHNPSSVVTGPGLAPKLLRAEFNTIPEAWRRLVDAIHIHHIDLTPSGVASLFVEGTEEKITQFVAENSSVGPVRSRIVAAGPADRLTLTPRQLDALATAVALGYYEIPHRVDLRALAASMDISLGSVSELLRRGEAAVITSFVDRVAASRWERTDEPLPVKPLAPTPPAREVPSLGFRRFV